MTQDYLQRIHRGCLPRLPLKGSIDLTYRCNNDCRHCWLRIAPGALEKREELSFEEIRKIADDARRMGCREWAISGGEPMLRPDFPEIFDYLTSHASSYSLNTNGALITSRIAKLMTRKGVKMVALYGATAEVHDHITRNPGSFEATMRGFAYLKEAGAGFMVQLIPMRDNHHQFDKMVALAESLSKHYRVGAAWLYLSACGDKERNAEILRQRLPPKAVIELDEPDLSQEEQMAEEPGTSCQVPGSGGYLFAPCIESRRDFHVDAYGKMSFCCYIKDPSMRYDLRDGSFEECWDRFVPSLSKKVVMTEDYGKNCGSCELRANCRVCPVYAYLEHRDYNRKVEYLCAVARENKKYKEDWKKNNRRYFKIADITVQVESDLPFRQDTFHAKFDRFAVEGPGEDMIRLRHHFLLPDLEIREFGQERYYRAPWAIYKKNGSWIYLGIPPQKNYKNIHSKNIHRVVTFNADHTRAEIYNDQGREKNFLEGNLHSLTMFPTDQILIARILADRQGFYLHSSGVIFEDKGLLFVGHSEAGKSTMVKSLMGKAEILCDERMILRKKDGDFRIHGTWSHGEVPEVSSNSAPLRAILFLEKAPENRAILVEDKKE
nr:radical SAM protein [Candidatus Omnitrophota bacterium]